MKIKGLIHGILIGVSYYSMKKVLNRYPEPIRKAIISLLRVCLFLVIFLSLFSFFTVRVNSIGSNINSLNVIENVLIGICFFISFVIAFILTAVIEEIYRKLSQIKQQTEEKIESAKETAQAPARVIKSSVLSMKSTFKKTGKLIGDSSKKLYATSAKITNAALDVSISKFGKIIRKKKKEDQKDG